MKNYTKKTILDKDMKVGCFYVGQTNNAIYSCWFKSPSTKQNYFYVRPRNGILLVLKKETNDEGVWIQMLHLKSGIVGWTFDSNCWIQEVDFSLETRRVHKK